MDLLTELLPGLIGAVLMLFVVLAVLYDGAKHWSHTIYHATPAAGVAGFAVLLGLPGAALLFAWPLEPGVGAEGARLSAAAGAAAGSLGNLYWLVTLVFAVTVGLRLAERHPYPLLYAQAQRLTGWRQGAISGAVLGGVSVWLFTALGVEAGPVFAVWERLLESPEARWFAWPALACTVLGAAITEEILYRGVVQPWLVRRLSGLGRGGPWLAILGTSLLWAVAHSANTTEPLIKIGQIVVVGLWFGHLARRHSVEASIAAHLTLNGTSMFW